MSTAPYYSAYRFEGSPIASKSPLRLCGIARGPGQFICLRVLEDIEPHRRYRNTTRWERELVEDTLLSAVPGVIILCRGL